MPSAKEELIDEITRCRSASLNEIQIARKIFLLDPAFVFKDNRVIGFQILNSIAEKFRVGIGCIKIAGSSQTGYSVIKKRDFVLGESDLDIAIVNPSLFQRYCEIVFQITNCYKDYTKFKDMATAEQFEENLRAGFFRPDLMPHSPEKTQWFTFFNGLTNQHSAIFRDVNAGIYFSERFFEGKQVDIIKSLI